MDSAGAPCPQQRARHLVYLPPPDTVVAWMAASQQRCAAWKQTEIDGRGPQRDGRGQQSLEAGQLKAAEALARIRNGRRKYQEVMNREVRLMVACQPTSQEALRLEVLLQPPPKKKLPADCLNRAQRRRVHQILEDDAELTIIRT